MIHWLWYGPKRGVYAKPQARCGMAVPQTQLSGSERRVTCPRCLEIMHATEPEGPITQTRDNAGVPEEGAVEHLKNAAAILQANLELGEKDALVADDARAVLARIRTALRQLESRRVNTPLSGRQRHGSVRQGNPALAILGNPPRAVGSIKATFAKMEYVRPDDPDGNDIMRVHEFKDGVIMTALADGSVHLWHPRHAVWVEDGT